MTVEIRNAIEDSVRFLSRRGVIEPDELFPVHALFQDRKITTDETRIERPLGNSKIGNQVGSKLEARVSRGASG